jgi:hypothetical protein
MGAVFYGSRRVGELVEESRLNGTVARWPKISKEAPKNCPWPEKVGGRQLAEFDIKWQKRGRKIFFTII